MFGETDFILGSYLGPGTQYSSIISDLIAFVNLKIISLKNNLKYPSGLSSFLNYLKVFFFFYFFLDLSKFVKDEDSLLIFLSLLFSFLNVSLKLYFGPGTLSYGFTISS